MLAYGTFGGVGIKLQVFYGSSTMWRVDKPIYVAFTSSEHLNLYTTLDFKAARVLDFRLKYDPVFSEV